MSTPPNLIGVLDLMGGHVVRAIGGRRDEYRPVESRLCSSSKPLDIACAFRDVYGIEQLYVADLDAIRGGLLHAEAIAALAKAGFRLTLDAGFRAAADLGSVSDLGVECFVAAVESLADAGELDHFVEQVGATRVRFSIDLAGGVPLAEPSRWNRMKWTEAAPVELASQAEAAGIAQLIVLDLHTVGTQQGPSTAAALSGDQGVVARSIDLDGRRSSHDCDDVLELIQAGADGVLVASALHDQTLGRALRS